MGAELKPARGKQTTRKGVAGSRGKITTYLGVRLSRLQALQRHESWGNATMYSQTEDRRSARTPSLD